MKKLEEYVTKNNIKTPLCLTIMINDIVKSKSNKEASYFYCNVLIKNIDITKLVIADFLEHNFEVYICDNNQFKIPENEAGEYLATEHIVDIMSEFYNKDKRLIVKTKFNMINKKKQPTTNHFKIIEKV